MTRIGTGRYIGMSTMKSVCITKSTTATVQQSKKKQNSASLIFSNSLNQKKKLYYYYLQRIPDIGRWWWWVKFGKDCYAHLEQNRKKFFLFHQCCAMLVNQFSVSGSMTKSMLCSFTEWIICYGNRKWNIPYSLKKGEWTYMHLKCFHF